MINGLKKKKGKIEDYKNGISHRTRDCEESTGSSGIGKCLALSCKIQYALGTYCGIFQAKKIWLYSTKSQTIGPGWGTSQEMVIGDILFHLFPNFSSLIYGPKSTRLGKIYISTCKSLLSEVNVSWIWKSNLVNILLDNMADSPVWFTMLIILSLKIYALILWFHLCWLLYIDKHNVKRGIVKGDRQQPRNFKHKGKHKIGFYPKSILVFTTYQVQGRWTMIISPVKAEPDGSNVR